MPTILFFHFATSKLFSRQPPDQKNSGLCPEPLMQAQWESLRKNTRAVSVHLDAQSTQRHRREQMRSVLDALPSDLPVILGGDWNTSTYDSSHACRAILGFWLRVMM